MKKREYSLDVYDHIDRDTWIKMAVWVDGEGCITILASGRQHGSGFQDVRVNVSQSDLRLMRWLMNNFGGSFNPSKGKHRACYNWYVGGNRAEALIRGIRPHLLIKGEQADIALEYRSTVQKQEVKGRNRKLAEGVQERREVLKQKLQHIKRNPPDQEMVQ